VPRYFRMSVPSSSMDNSPSLISESSPPHQDLYGQGEAFAKALRPMQGVLRAHRDPFVATRDGGALSVVTESGGLGQNSPLVVESISMVGVEWSSGSDFFIARLPPLVDDTTRRLEV